MPSGRKGSENSLRRRGRWSSLGPSRWASAGRAHLSVMDTATRTHQDSHATDGPGLGPVLSMSQLAEQLGVAVQTLYDLRSQGRGPVGFRVGRELRFRISEVEAWLLRLEEADAERHPEVSR